MKNGKRPTILGIPRRAILHRVALCGVIAILLAACSPGRFVSVVNPFDNSDEETLAALYNATGGADWKNSSGWMSDRYVGTWHGVRYFRDERPTGNPMGGQSTSIVEGVRGLELNSNGLKGEIPSELGKLGNLTHLYLSGNQLSGEIPSELGKLDFLSYLHLGRNQLSGEIPSEMGSIRDLTALNLSSNRLSGEIPPELGNLRRLSYLYLNDNRLTGEIPSRLGRLHALYVGGNQFTGCIPSRLRSVGKNDFLRLGLDFCGGGESLVPRGSDTEALVALYNAAGGENWRDNTNWMTSESVCRWYGVSCRGSRTNSVLSLNLIGNNLSGELPPELGNLTGMRIMHLAQNDLSGDIPAELGDNPILRQIYLNDNRLSGEIPPELGNIERLELLNLSRNNLEGSLPSELGNLGELETLGLIGNRFTGCVPPRMARVRSFNISDVSLLFCEFTDRAALVDFYRATGGPGWINSTNWLSDEPVHRWHGIRIGSTGRVGAINLPENQLSGEIPAELDALTNLASLNLQDNQLTGEIPAELGNLTNLRTLLLNGNQLSGNIPFELNNLSKLKRGELTGNQLTGCIPGNWVGRLLKRRSMGIPFCNDTGEPPDRAALVALYRATDGDNWADNTNWLSQLPLGKWKGVVTNDFFRVNRLALVDNRLTGELPPELGQLTKLEYLSLEGNHLTGEIAPELTELSGTDSLRHVNLSDNQLTGEIPAELGNAVRLNWLHLSGNQLTGQIPPELGRLSHLERLDLSGNRLTGQIPPELGNVTSMKRLYLSANGLTGDIPPELGNLTNLNHLLIQTGNELTGCMPASFRQRRDSYPGGPGRFAYFRHPDFLPLCEP